jgi:hypothetical protein
MTDLSKKLKGLRDHTPSLHGSGHHHHQKKDINVTMAMGIEVTKEGNAEERLAKWAEEQVRENHRDESRNM